MESKNSSKKILSIMLSLIMLFTVSAPNTFAETLSENQNKKQLLEEENSALESKLSDLKDDVEKKQEYKNTLDEDISVVRSEIEVINSKISLLDAQIAEKEQMIETVNQDIEKNYKKLRQRLKSIYMAGETSNLEIVLGAKNFSDFLDKAEIIQRLSEHDNALINNLQKEVEEVKESKQIIEDNKAQVANEKKLLDEKQNDLQALSHDIEQVISELEQEEVNVKNKIDENDEETQKINNEIEAYYQEQARLEQERLERERLERERQNNIVNDEDNSNNNVNDNINNNNSSSSADINTPASSNYAWPVPGFTYISSDYYDTIDRRSMHRAIDIAGSGIYGANVVAADSGTVIFCCKDGYGGGYGNYVVIDHGNGKSTLYAHMSAVAVSCGQYVAKGQTVGYVGNTGYSTGPHLHFETRLNGIKYNPMDEY